ncbi:MAG: hypothetical protein K0R14_1841 [Burkholderiales bacterium]|jgi:predicted AAA+ superfamily ATPase|nr:hypothetical protein [Burkholderiales bacterium]
MKRDIYKQLLAWKNSPRRKPLILQGARQVGKTYALKDFAGKDYDHMIYCNFETNIDLASLFAKNIDPTRIIENLEIQFGQKILPEKTLIIFDEIQACPEALNSLKYFHEQANHYHIVAAGSLLGVKLNQIKSFPVGQVNFMHLAPLSFLEFLDAISQSSLREFLENINEPKNIPLIFHNELLEQLKRYFYIGGMPEAVFVYIENQDFNLVREVHQEILRSYELDFSKHAPKNQVMKITEVWQSIPPQLAKENRKFIFSLIKASARAREYEDAILWLKDAGLIHLSYNISTPKTPIEHYCDKKSFKVFGIDTGLLSTMSRIPLTSILAEDKLFSEFKGALTENFVAQQLTAYGHDRLYYWTSSGTAEVDFVIDEDLCIFPLEVKAGVNVAQKKSLIAYNEKYNPQVLSRASLLNLSLDGKLINYPLYAMHLFPKLSK